MSVTLITRHLPQGDAIIQYKICKVFIKIRFLSNSQLQRCFTTSDKMVLNITLHCCFFSIVLHIFHIQRLKNDCSDRYLKLLSRSMVSIISE